MDKGEIDKKLHEKSVFKEYKRLKKSWNMFIIGTLIIFLLLIVVFYFLMQKEPDWKISDDGLLYYAPDRGPPIYKYSDIGSMADTTIVLSYESRGATVHGVLRIPKTDVKRVPGIVLLPGAGVTKEMEQQLALVLRDMGYATLTIDQRGVGESEEKLRDLDVDYNLFRWGNEPTAHKIVYDALKAYDLLSEREEIDHDRIIILGESMGGRVGIIATALEPGIRGVVGISTGGYGLGNVSPGDNLTLFQRSFDPDTYIGSISPRKVLMIHSRNDNIIIIENAERTFSFANEPKRLVYVDCEMHGYCDEMSEELEEGIAWVLGS
ncbi:MAG: alpha/beta fold hydrolase [Candidatus Micrarchaeota archaeon]